MKSIKVFGIILLGLATIVTVESHKKKRPVVEPKNNVLFEKFEYEITNTTWIDVHYVDIRPVQRNILRFNASFSLTVPINQMFLHILLYYKYNTYQKFLIHQIGEVCAFSRGEYLNPLGKIFRENLMDLNGGMELNFEIQCPYYGDLRIYHSGVNFSQVNFPLLPAGRYRFDVSFTPTRNGPVYAKYFVYFAISDIRVWF